MPPAGLKAAMPASELPQACDLDSEANGIGICLFIYYNNSNNYYYYYLLQLSCHSVAVVLTLVTNKNKYT